MADYKNLDVATEDLDELIDVLDARIKKGGFEVGDVVWMVKAWTKVTIRAGLLNDLKPYWIMNRPPAVVAGKRSHVLLHALEDYSNLLERGTTSGDFYKRAKDSMLNFVWDYRQHISGKQEMDFVQQMQAFMSLGTDQLMREPVFKMDRSI